MHAYIIGSSAGILNILINASTLLFQVSISCVYTLKFLSKCIDLESSIIFISHVHVHAQVIGMCHIFSNDNPEKARVMVWVLGGLTGLAG